MPRRSLEATRLAKPAAKRAPRRRPPARANPVEAALASLAHEVRTPLNGILALAELLAASDLPEREREWAMAVKSAAEHLAGLTTIVVDGARAGARGLRLQHELFDASALALALAQSLDARATVKGVTADVSIAAELPRQALGDKVRLRAAVENLIDNAIKFGRAGTVRLVINAVVAADQRTMLTFELTDEGIGLSKSDLGRLFRPFAQGNADLARQFGGAGLGLAFARRIARAMRGDVTVASVPGQGSTFRLTAAVDQAPAPDNAGSGRIDAGRAEPSTTRVLRLLCAEDNPYGRVVLNTMASALGHRIDFVESGDAAVKAVRQGEYDAVLMDVMLQGRDGMEATRRIRALAGAASAVPIIGISGRGTADEAAARQAGMNAYLVKPVSPSTLSRALETVLQDGSSRDGEDPSVRRAGSVRRSPKAPPRR